MVSLFIITAVIFLLCDVLQCIVESCYHMSVCSSACLSVNFGVILCKN